MVREIVKYENPRREICFQRFIESEVVGLSPQVGVIGFEGVVADINVELG